jgi:hypothetical protein
MSLIETEDRYLLLLRRFTLGTAALLLAAAVLLGAYSAVEYARAAYLTNSNIRLPTNAELQVDVNPCPYLLNTESGSNGTNLQGDIAVLGVLSACDLEVLPLADYETLDAAYNAATNSFMSILPANDFSFNDEADAREGFMIEASDVVEQAVSPIASLDPEIVSEEAKNQATLAVANLLSYYASAVASVSQATASYAIPFSDERTREHLLLSSTYFENQVYVAFNTSSRNYVTAQTEGAVVFVWATGLLWSAAGVFFAFLLLMFIFVFIKMEVDLRDIRDQLSRT